MKKSYNFLLGIIFIVICFLFSVNLAKAEEKQSPVYESKPKELIIYQNSLALAKDSIEVYPADRIQLLLPPTVITRTLEVIDGNKKIGELYLIQPTGSAYREPAQSTMQRVEWESEIKESRQVILRYLLRGISWSSSYDMNILSGNKVKLRYLAAINNQALSLPKVNIKLASGLADNISGPSERAEPYVALTPGLGPTNVNIYYTYELPQIQMLEKGINYITILDKELEADKEFVWLTSAEKKVDTFYTIKNSTEQPFATGIVDIYRDGFYIGSGIVERIPIGGIGQVVIGGALDVQVKKNVKVNEDPNRDNNKYNHEVTLEIKNLSKENIKVKVIDNKYPNYVDIVFSLKPAEEKAQTYMWQINIEPGKTKTIRYSFYANNAYDESYRAYR